MIVSLLRGLARLRTTSHAGLIMALPAPQARRRGVKLRRRDCPSRALRPPTALTASSAPRPIFLGAFLLMAALGATAQAERSVTLAWDPSPDPTVVGYRVYVGVASYTYTNVTDVGNNTTATIPDLTVGVTYFFAVTAYDSSGLESDFSGEISYTVPAPQVTLQLTLLPNQQARLTGTGLAGYTYDVLAAEDLAAWSLLGNVTAATDGTLQFTDSTATNAVRFYRLRQSSP